PDVGRCTEGAERPAEPPRPGARAVLGPPPRPAVPPGVEANEPGPLPTAPDGPGGRLGRRPGHAQPDGRPGRAERRPGLARGRRLPGRRAAHAPRLALAQAQPGHPRPLAPL